MHVLIGTLFPRSPHRQGWYIVGYSPQKTQIQQPGIAHKILPWRRLILIIYGREFFPRNLRVFFTQVPFVCEISHTKKLFFALKFWRISRIVTIRLRFVIHINIQFWKLFLKIWKINFTTTMTPTLSRIAQNLLPLRHTLENLDIYGRRGPYICVAKYCTNECRSLRLDWDCSGNSNKQGNIMGKRRKSRDGKILSGW